MRKIIYICSCLFLTACASSTQSHLNKVQQGFANNNYEISDETPNDQSNLDLLINGTALFHADKYKESDSTFQEFNKRNLTETKSSFSREATGLLLGGGVNSYKPYMMDSLFVSYYQIWDLLAMQDWSNARVVINQSYARQQNMSYEYKSLIERNKNKISENSHYGELVDKNLADWAAFSDIMNPALMYLSGIYFLNDGDFNNAITYLKRANGMMPENTFIKKDLEMAQQRIKPKYTTWQFIETGFAPRLREKEASLFLPDIGLIYFTISDPYTNDNFTQPKGSQMLANVDAMFITEYREYQINEAIRAFTSAASKTAMQATAYNSNNKHATFFGILSSIYTVMSSNTDVRTWATLPKYIYVIRNEKNLNKQNNLIYTRIINDNITDNKTINLN